MNITEVVHPKFVPVMVTMAPTAPLVGVNDAIVGTPAVAAMKFAVLGVSVPCGLHGDRAGGSTAGTVVVTVVSLTTVTGWPSAPVKSTPVAPVNPEPVIVIPVPAGPHVGVNDVMDRRRRWQCRHEHSDHPEREP